MIFTIISLFYNIRDDIFLILSKKKNFIIILLKDKNKIRIGIVTNSFKNGGIGRQTSLLLKYLNKIDLFILYLFTREGKNKDDYILDNNIKRMAIDKNFINLLKKEKVDILIYQQYNIEEIGKLNRLNKIKIIYINHSCYIYWIYQNLFGYIKNVYKAYKQAKYIISLIPFENDYLFKKWGINSILMNNFIPYDYKSIIPSDLSSKTILMIGRGSDKLKRFELGIESMKYIVKEIPKCEMMVISELTGITYLQKLIQKINLENHIKFVGYNSNPEIFFKNASLHIFPSVAEAFPNVLSETLIYGIPNILVGLDYLSNAKGGTVIIYDDSPLSIAKIAIKILFRQDFGFRRRRIIPQIL